MELIATQDDRQVWHHELARPYRLEPPFHGDIYVCILFVHDRTVTDEERKALSDQLVRSNCRYAVCAGHDADRWHLSVDLAYLDYHPSEKTFVMTTSHEDESVEEVIWFGLMNTCFDYNDFTRYLVLSVGHRAEFRQALGGAIDEVWSGHTKV